MPGSGGSARVGDDGGGSRSMPVVERVSNWGGGMTCSAAGVEYPLRMCRSGCGGGSGGTGRGSMLGRGGDMWAEYEGGGGPASKDVPLDVVGGTGNGYAAARCWESLGDDAEAPCPDGDELDGAEPEPFAAWPWWAKPGDLTLPALDELVAVTGLGWSDDVRSGELLLGTGEMRTGDGVDTASSPSEASGLAM